LGGVAAATWAGSTGALNTAVGALQTATGALDTAVGNLNTATGTLNTAVGDLHADKLDSTWTNTAAVANMIVSSNLTAQAMKIGAAAVLPTGVGACFFGSFGVDTEASGIGAVNRGDSGYGDIMSASEIGAGNFGKVSGGAMYANAIGALNLGYVLNGFVTNSGIGSISLCYSNGKKITNSHPASIVLGEGKTQEPESIIASVVRTRSKVVTPDLQITGGSPMEGAILMATGSSGLSRWATNRVYVSGYSAQTTNIIPFTITCGFKPTAMVAFGAVKRKEAWCISATDCVRGTTRCMSKFDGTVGFMDTLSSHVLYFHSGVASWQIESITVLSNGVTFYPNKEAIMYTNDCYATFLFVE
jgi:hypothetical protein